MQRASSRIGWAMSTAVSAGRLLGRHSECAALNELVASLRAGKSRALLLRGEAGIGKTALLEHLVASASDLTVVRAGAVELEMEIDHAGLQQLCGLLLDRLRGSRRRSDRRSRSCSA